MLAVLLASGLCQARGPGQSDDKDKQVDKKGDPNTPPQDDEDDKALQPVEVSGAYLTGFGAASGDGIPVKAGFRPVGLNIYQAKTGLLVQDPVAVQSFKFTDSNGATSVVEPEKISGYTAWQAVVLIPESIPDEIPGAEVLVSINESADLAIAGLVSGIARDGDNDSGQSNSVSAVSEAPAPLENVSEHKIFVSNGRYKPGVDFSDILKANELCNSEAVLDPELKTYWWKAVLAAEDQTIAQRIPLYGPVENLLGQPIIPAGTALAGAELAAGSLQFANFGTVGAGENNDVFTGSRKDGSVGETCKSWTSASGNGTVGSPASGGAWIEASAASCGEARRLYCISSKVRKEPN
jgi:hypothetical protein